MQQIRLRAANIILLCAFGIVGILFLRNFFWGDGITVNVINETGAHITGCYVIFASGLADVPELEPGESRAVTIRPKKDSSLDIVYAENRRRYKRALDSNIAPLMRGTLAIHLKEGGRGEVIDEVHMPSAWEALKPW